MTSKFLNNRKITAIKNISSFKNKNSLQNEDKSIVMESIISKSKNLIVTNKYKIISNSLDSLDREDWDYIDIDKKSKQKQNLSNFKPFQKKISKNSSIYNISEDKEILGIAEKNFFYERNFLRSVDFLIPSDFWKKLNKGYSQPWGGIFKKNQIKNSEFSSDDNYKNEEFKEEDSENEELKENRKVTNEENFRNKNSSQKEKPIFSFEKMFYIKSVKSFNVLNNKSQDKTLNIFGIDKIFFLKDIKFIKNFFQK